MQFVFLGLRADCEPECRGYHFGTKTYFLGRVNIKRKQVLDHSQCCGKGNVAVPFCFGDFFSSALGVEVLGDPDAKEHTALDIVKRTPRTPTVPGDPD